MNQSTIHDGIIAFLRERPEGVAPKEIAERFLKMRAADAVAAVMVKGMLSSDRRCFADPAGLWHAVPKSAVESPNLAALPWVAVYCLTDPSRRVLLHVSAWEVAPEAICMGSGWVADPAMLPFEEREQLLNTADEPYSAEAARVLLQRIVVLCEERIPVFLSSSTRWLFEAACVKSGETFTDDSTTAGQLLRAAGIAMPRPATLDGFESAIGAPATGDSARKQGERFAAAAGEVLRMLGRCGIESRRDLDSSLQKESEPFFAGKAFTYEELLCLPGTPGVYGFKNLDSEYLYIGKAKNLRRRLLGYFRETDESPAKLERIRAESYALITHQCGSELESLLYEYRLIRKYQPPLNRNIEIAERNGTHQPVDDCIILLPHAVEGKGMSVWVRKAQKILLKSFDSLPETDPGLIRELDSFFFSSALPPASTDFSEQEIAERWIKKHQDALEIVPVSRMADGNEVYEAMKIAWKVKNEE